MSKYLEILADVKAKLEAVSNIGVVYDYERQAADLGKFIALFKTTIGGKPQVRGWEITRRAVPEHWKGAVSRHHQFVLKGYLGIDDAAATSKTFQVLVEAVCDAYRAAKATGQSTWLYQNGDDPDLTPAQVEIMEDLMFGPVLCHYAQIALSVTERKDP